jgi:hypothetical protein
MRVQIAQSPRNKGFASAATTSDEAISIAGASIKFP